jgi:two-component system nitrate/nitrite response regulator NarL
VQNSSGRSCSGVRVIVVDATRIGSESLAIRLKRDRCSEIYVGTSPQEALDKAPQADVALVSSTLEGDTEKGYELTRQMRLAAPDLQVVILVDRTDAQSVLQAFRSGARGILGRDGPLDRISKCVSRVSQGQVWASSEELQHLLEALAAPPRLHLTNATGVEMLAPREQEVVHWVAEGLTNREIAEQLQLSANTVKNYLFRIFDKLGISNRVELILFAATQLNNGNGRALSNGAKPTIVRSPDGDSPCLACADQFTVAHQALAENYLQGRGTKVDKTNALTWFMIAEGVSEHTLTKSAQARMKLESELPPREVANAKRRATEWMTKHKFAAVSAPEQNTDRSTPLIAKA